MLCNQMLLTYLNEPAFFTLIQKISLETFLYIRICRTIRRYQGNVFEGEKKKQVLLFNVKNVIYLRVFISKREYLRR